MNDAGVAMFEPTSFYPDEALDEAAARSRCKRGLDIAVALGLLTLLAPLLLMLAAAIRLESRGPALFRQRRGGLRGAPFMILKLRTMTVAEDGDAVHQARRHDPRVTRLGRILRRTSLDELPQLINVLRGEMSLVGPRPHALAHDRRFQALVPAYDRRFAVRPGITGLAQVRGLRGEIRDLNQLKGRTACDVLYVETWSLAGDVVILLATLKAPLHPNAH